MEPRRNRPKLPLRQKMRILMVLHYAELFEKFLHTRYQGQKRFSLEGAETTIPVLDAMIEKVARAGGKGSRHRHGPPRPAQRPDQHPPQAVPGRVRRIRGRLRPGTDRRRRRRQVPPRLFQRLRDGQGAQDPPVAVAQSQPPGGGQSGGRGPGAGQAAGVRRHRADDGHSAVDPRRRGLRRPGVGRRDAEPVATSPATAPAARCTSSSTTRSASRPTRPTPVRRTTAPTWPR